VKLGLPPPATARNGSFVHPSGVQFTSSEWGVREMRPRAVGGGGTFGACDGISTHVSILLVKAPASRVGEVEALTFWLKALKDSGLGGVPRLVC